MLNKDARCREVAARVKPEEMRARTAGEARRGERGVSLLISDLQSIDAERWAPGIQDP